MESLALLVTLMVLTVAGSGVLAWAATANGYIYVGGVLGCVAIGLGCIWVATAVMPVALVGWLSVAFGAWSVWHAWWGKPPY